MSLFEDLTEFVQSEYPGWEVEDDRTMICPCGEQIEHDGDCDECGPSPFKLMGMI